MVNSYVIDTSYQNYNRNDISGDVQQAIIEVDEMAHSAYTKIMQPNPSRNTINLLRILAGSDHSKYPIVGRLLKTLVPV